MTHKTIALIVIAAAICITLFFPEQSTPRKQILSKTLIGPNGDTLEYRVELVGKTCYEDVRNGQVTTRHCH